MTNLPYNYIIHTFFPFQNPNIVDTMLTHVSYGVSACFIPLILSSGNFRK